MKMGVSVILLQQRQNEAIEPGQVLPRLLLAICEVKAPVTGVRDVPKTADGVRESLQAHAETADVIANLSRLLPVADAL